MSAQVLVYYTIATGEVFNISYGWNIANPQNANYAYVSCGAGVTPACLGTATISGNTVTLNGMHLFDGDSDAILNGSITSTGISVGSGSSGGTSTDTLVISVTASGVALADITVTGIPAPTSSDGDGFCSGIADDPNFTALGNGSSFTINSCTFSGNVGTVTATLNAQGFTLPYTVVYTFN